MEEQKNVFDAIFDTFKQQQEQILLLHKISQQHAETLQAIIAYINTSKQNGQPKVSELNTISQVSKEEKNETDKTTSVRTD